MRLFLFLVFTGVWTGVAKLIDHWTHSFGLSFIVGAVAAIVIVGGIAAGRASAIEEAAIEQQRLEHP
jgi:hypothetical protein